VDRSTLSRLVNEADEEHHDSMATLVDQFGESFFGTEAQATAPSRRSFLTRLAAGASVGAALTFVAAQPAAAAGPQQPNATDIQFLAWAQSLELAAVAAYGIAIASGKLSGGATTAATIFRQHHRDHAAAMGAAAGKNNSGVANASVVTKLGPSFSTAKTETDLLMAAFKLETAATSTYLNALGKLSGSDPAAAVAAILPTESRHAVVLGQVLVGLGAPKFTTDDYLPLVEADTSALDPADYPIGG
jgi:Ferritin-like domain